MGDTTPTTTPTTSTVPTTDATMNTNATMNVNDVSTLIAQQVQQHTATLVNRITELENRNGVLERAARDDRMDSIWDSKHVVMDLVVTLRQLSLACMVVIWVVMWMHGYSRCFSIPGALAQAM